MILFDLLTGVWVACYIYSVSSLCFTWQKKRTTRVLLIILLAGLNTLNKILIPPFLSFFIYCTLLFLFLHFLFQLNFITILFFSMTIYIIRFLFEESFIVLLSLLHINIPSYTTLYILSTILTLETTVLFKEKIKERITKPYFFKDHNIIIKYFISNFLLLDILIVRMPRFEINLYNYLNILFLILLLFNITLLLLREKEKNNALSKNLTKVVEYSEFTEGLLSEYKYFLHEYKNKLMIIKGLLPPKQKETHEYIDSLLEEKAINHYRWLMEIKSIPITGVKGLINLKLLKMKELNIEVEVYISEKIAQLKKDYFSSQEKNDINTILGILFDNAIEACLENNTKKMASFQMYEENQNLIILLANTFKSIHIDQIEEKGFSTKGKNRGFGLYILNETIKRNSKLKKETSIFEDFFIQKIIIETPKQPNITK